MMRTNNLCLLLFLCSLVVVAFGKAFIAPSTLSTRGAAATAFQHHHHRRRPRRRVVAAPLAAQQTTVTLDTRLDDDRVADLFAWVSCALSGDDDYNNLMLAIAAIFGNLDETTEAGQVATRMLGQARNQCPNEETLVGQAFSTDEREIASLGAMGAAQWTGQFQTRPHALLQIANLTSVDDWVATLPRGCNRTIKRALAQNFTVTSQPILGGRPAPHSNLAHFRCVMAHEVRLLSCEETGAGFYGALQEGISRYMGTTRMAGEIHEYRDENGKIMAIAHEVRKGKVVRGQWFYANDQAAKQYVWFHSIYDLVRRAIDTDGIDVVDLGPSGTDAFSQLKERYGFESHTDWTALADYSGPFHRDEQSSDGTNVAAMYELQLQAEARSRFRLF